MYVGIIFCHNYITNTKSKQVYIAFMLLFYFSFTAKKSYENFSGFLKISRIIEGDEIGIVCDMRNVYKFWPGNLKEFTWDT